MAQDNIVDNSFAVTKHTTGRTVVKRILSMDRHVLVGLSIVILLVFISAIGAFTGPDAYQMDTANRLLPPAFMEGGNSNYILGTDGLGRDLFARLSLGLFVSLSISVTALVLAVVIGIIVGMSAGFFGNLADTILMRLTDVQMAFPFIILAVSVLSVTRPTFVNIILVLSLVTWPIYARIVRSLVLSEKGKDYVKAIETIGGSKKYILTRHIAPNVLPAVLSVAPLDIAVIVILEAILGFLGIGVQSPIPSWGNIMADGRPYLVNAWWVATLPGIWILVTVFGTNLIGMGLKRKHGRTV